MKLARTMGCRPLKVSNVQLLSMVNRFLWGFGGCSQYFQVSWCMRPYDTMKYHAILCNTMQYPAIQCNNMQYHASLITADGAYHCPVGSIWLFFLLHCHRLPGYPTHIHPLPRKIGQGLKTIQKMVRTE